MLTLVRSWIPGAALALAVALPLSGCGATTHSSTPTLTAALALAERAESVHIVGGVISGTTSGAFDLRLVRGQGCEGVVFLHGFKIGIVTLASKLYIRGTDAFWIKQGASPLVVRAFHGKWVLAPEGRSKGLSSFRVFTSIDGLIGMLSSSAGKTGPTHPATFERRPVFATRDAGGDTVYIAPMGQPRLVAVVFGQGVTGQIVFNDWNTAGLVIHVPRPVIDPSQLRRSGQPLPAIGIFA